MTHKEKSYREQETEKRFGKKRFLVRKEEEIEAQREIKDYLESADDFIPENSEESLSGRKG